MLLTIRTTTSPASDLGYLLAKHPDRAQSFSLAFGTAHVVYPESTDEGCTCALVLDVDPIGLVRREHATGPGRGAPGSIFQYVNDRPYASTSFLSVAISQVFGSALNGTCNARPELVHEDRDLEAHLPALPCRTGSEVLRRLFEPLGYEILATERPLDETVPEWGTSRTLDVRLRARTTVQRLLQHLYVLVPVLDGEKHYWVGDAEVEKLLRKGADWLGDHPEREFISRRYLKNDRSLMHTALMGLDGSDTDTESSEGVAPEATPRRPANLQRERMKVVSDAVVASGATTVLDLGCGEGQLLRELLIAKRGTQRAFDRILGIDVSMRALERATMRLKLDRLAPAQRERIELAQGALTYRDERFAGFDCAALIEVIEHLETTRLDALERVLFEFASPRTVIISTPNAEYNVRFDNLSSDATRHSDHRFEWTRAEFESWCEGVARRHGYTACYRAIGPVHEEFGAPTQMAIFILGGTPS